jgi:hypothetical protein
MDSTILQRNDRPTRYVEAATHLFATGQIVRLKGGVPLPSQSGNTYRITGTLPPRGDSPQYRIRNDDERYERVATQDSSPPPISDRGGRFDPLRLRDVDPPAPRVEVRMPSVVQDRAANLGIRARRAPTS